MPSKASHPTRRLLGASLKTAAAAALLCAGQVATAADILPYAESWYAPSLAAARTNLGLNHAILSFGITRGSCVLDPTMPSRLADARQFVNMGGKLSISMGGADGVYVEAACSDDQMFAIMDKLIQDSGTRRIDWDIEGHNLSNYDATARRNRVLLRLQAKYPDLFTSITLSAWFRGVNAGSLHTVKSAVDAGVRVHMVNAMVQSFGRNNIQTMISPPTLAQASIVSFNATRDQMRAIFPGKTTAQLNAMMGMTPMIGWNDDGTVFTLQDAKIVADFAKANGIGWLGYWAFARDKAQSTGGLLPVNHYTGVVQSAWQYLNIFRTAEGPVNGAAPAPAPAPIPVAAPAPAPAPTPVAAPAPAPATTAGTAWNSTTRYAAGTVVSHLGKTYTATALSATAWNVNSPPDQSATLWSLSTTAAPVAGGTTCTTASAWVQGKLYTQGTLVSYNGKVYTAKYANPGYVPTISTYYWAPAAC